MHEDRSAWREDGEEKYPDKPMNKREKEDKEYEGNREHDAAGNNKVTVTIESGTPHNQGTSHNNGTSHNQGTSHNNGTSHNQGTSHNPGKMGGGKGNHAGLLY